MDSLLVITIPMVLIVIGIALNSFHIVHDQPQFSLEKIQLINSHTSVERTTTSFICRGRE